MTSSIENAQSTIRATTANALAEALILGIDECAQRGIPLTQTQQVALAAMTVMSYDQALEACESVATWENIEAQLGSRRVVEIG